MQERVNEMLYNIQSTQKKSFTEVLKGTN